MKEAVNSREEMYLITNHIQLVGQLIGEKQLSSGGFRFNAGWKKNKKLPVLIIGFFFGTNEPT